MCGYMVMMTTLAMLCWLLRCCRLVRVDPTGRERPDLSRRANLEAWPLGSGWTEWGPVGRACRSLCSGVAIMPTATAGAGMGRFFLLIT
jgi:hypothetical protein